MSLLPLRPKSLLPPPATLLLEENAHRRERSMVGGHPSGPQQPLQWQQRWCPASAESSWGTRGVSRFQFESDKCLPSPKSGSESRCCSNGKPQVTPDPDIAFQNGRLSTSTLSATLHCSRDTGNLDLKEINPSPATTISCPMTGSLRLQDFPDALCSRPVCSWP